MNNELHPDMAALLHIGQDLSVGMGRISREADTLSVNHWERRWLSRMETLQPLPLCNRKLLQIECATLGVYLSLTEGWLYVGSFVVELILSCNGKLSI